MYQSEESKSPMAAATKAGEDGNISTLYRRELSKGYFNTKQETQTIIPSTSDSSQSPTSENLKQMEKSFNAWKSKNHALNQARGEECTLDMVSNLGRSLENWHHVIPKTSPCCGNHLDSNMSNHNVELKSNQAFHNPNIFEQRKSCTPLLPSYSSQHYLEHGSDVQPSVNFFGNCSSQSRTVNEMFIPSPATHQKLVSRQDQHYSPQIKDKYLRETVSCSPYNQSMNYSPLLDKSNSSCHVGDHCYCNQSNYHCCKGNYVSCSCTRNSRQRKNDNLNNKQISDLYKIVYLQNQQLELLQRQVQKLIEINVKEDKPYSTAAGGPILLNKKRRGTKEKRTFNLAVIKENENLEKKVSVGIMTSFIENSFAKISCDELKITPKSKKKSKFCVDNHVSSTESTSDEEEDSSNVKCNFLETPQNRADRERNNVSFTLNDVTVPEENPPSPQASLHIDMQEYKTSSESESDSESSNSTTSDEKSSKPLGWTLYDTVVGKVNDMLQKSVDNEEKDLADDDVRNATIDHLRQLGVSFVEPESPVTKRVTFTKPKSNKMTSRQQLHCDSETSLHMNALANKYLKHEQHNFSGQKEYKVQKLGSPNNLSQATLRYLDRYQLSPSENKNDIDQHQEKIKKNKKKKEKLKAVEKVHSRQTKCGKILDITAIKKQPKLLPKNT
ncbi:uncharacterized protein [Rhodnius prolixus]|uniref:uncharacterized protein n=1 Tax=Rhodnius prolixus TaxID=13249 RepID=UPI003D18BDAB